MNNRIKEYRIFYTEGNLIKDNGIRLGTLEMLQNDFPDENWAIIPVEEVPDNWREMTIENRKLVTASAETIKQRQQVENEQKAALLREQRDKLLYETDKYMLPDYPITEEEREEYRQYRQYLREFKDNRISLFTTAKQGKMRWHTPYEITDPVQGKTYNRSEGGMYISNVRTDEGRFMEYGCEWIPEYTAPNKIVILDLDTMLA